MKRSAAMVGLTVALTLIFYLLAYFFLPGPSPSTMLVVLFAGISFVLTWLFQFGLKRLRSKKSKLTVLTFMAIALGNMQQAVSQVSIVTCRFTDGTTREIYDFSASPLHVGGPCMDKFGNAGFIVALTTWSSTGGSGQESDTMVRVTGAAI